MDETTRWALAARDGDDVAAAAFVRSTQADVWRLCRHLGDRDSADDLAQETYLRAFRALESFRAEVPVRVWLLGIARRTCADAVRRAVRRRGLAAPPSAYQVGPGDERVALDDLLARLDPDRRTAFVATQVLGLTYDEAAEICGCPVGTIRSRVARARADLVGHLRAAETA